MSVTTDAALHPGKAVTLRMFEAMAAGTLEDFAALAHPDFFNHEQRDEPPETRGPRPQQLLGVAEWLRAAYSELDWELHHLIAEGDLVVAHVTMSGRHTGDFAAYDADGRVDMAFAPTGRSFATTQSHWQLLRDGLVLEHWANRDDLGTARQLGWVPPSPAYLVRCALAARRARRAAGPPVPAQERPFGSWTAEGDPRRAQAVAALDRLAPPDAAFADPQATVHHVVAEDDLVAIHRTVRGRHTGPFAERDATGELLAVHPPTGRRFAMTETHWLRLAPDGGVVAHWAERDELGRAMQLGWVPPSPVQLVRTALATRRARRG